MGQGLTTMDLATARQLLADKAARTIAVGDRVSFTTGGLVSKYDTAGGIVVRIARDGRYVVRTLLRAELYVDPELCYFVPTALDDARTQGLELIAAYVVRKAEAEAQLLEDLAPAEAGTLPLELPAPAAGTVIVDELPLEFTTGDTIAVVPCSGAKLPTAAPAGELYVGSFHRIARQAGAAMAARGDADRVVILSALHGLLELDERVAPYDVTVGDAAAVAVEVLAAQLEGIRRVVALTPGAYTRLLAAACELADVELVTPLAGSRGIGEQRGRLARIRDAAQLAA